jgi:MFS family permease
MTATDASGDATRAGSEQRWSAATWGLLVVLAGNMLIDALEVSVVLVALPSVGADLRLPPMDTQWLVSGFAVGFGGTLLVGGRLTARYGRRPVYLAALACFALASIAGALATGPVILVATRVLKGVCAALTAPTGLAIISTTFDEGRDRDRAVSVYTLFGGCGFVTGVLLSGVLTELGWRVTFLFPAPVVLLLLALAWRLVPTDQLGAGGPPKRVPLSFRAVLSHAPTVRAMLTAAAFNGTNLGLLLITSIHLQTTLGWSPARTALAIAPVGGLLAVTALASRHLIGRFGTRRLIALGSVCPLAGCALYLRPPAHYVTDVMPTMLLMGLGFVLAFAALNVQATTGLAQKIRPAAGNLYQSAVQAAAVLTPPLVARLLVAGFDPAMEAVSAIAAIGAATGLSGLLPTRQTPSGG